MGVGSGAPAFLANLPKGSEDCVTEQIEPDHGPQPESAARPGVSTRLAIALVVVAVFAGVMAAKYMQQPSGGGNGGISRQSITTVRNDATSDYEAALKTGKPVYVLFHSMS